MEYKEMMTNGVVTVVENKQGQQAVLDAEGNIVVPFGKYAWIDGYDHGLARVHSEGTINYQGHIINLLQQEGNEKPTQEEISQMLATRRQEHPEEFALWGIINERGEEVLAVEYDEIWNFYKKNRNSTRVVKGAESRDVMFDDLLCSGDSDYFDMDDYYDYDEDDYGSHYGDFAGTYAQDEMGYSDDAINDAFDGDADNYWNID